MRLEAQHFLTWDGHGAGMQGLNGYVSVVYLYVWAGMGVKGVSLYIIWSLSFDEVLAQLLHSLQRCLLYDYSHHITPQTTPR